MVAERFIHDNLARLSKDSFGAVMTPEFTKQGEEQSSVSPPFASMGGPTAVPICWGHTLRRVLTCGHVPLSLSCYVNSTCPETTN